MIYQTRQGLAVERLCAYGIEKLLLDEIVAESRSFKEFCFRIFEVFSALRGKKCLLYFEKTPQNIHCAKEFLETFDDSYFIHIIRNPIYVFKSLRKRNVPSYIAANTWLIDVSRAYELRNHPRFVTVRYEDLVRDPFGVVIGFLNKLSISFDASELAELYRNNQYRKIASRKIKTWSVSQYGVIANANKKEITQEDRKVFSYMARTIISDSYAAKFNLEQVSFQTLLNYYSYESEIGQDFQLDGSLYDIRSFVFLVRKYFSDLRRGDCYPWDFFTYIKPVSIMS